MFKSFENLPASRGHKVRGARQVVCCRADERKKESQKKKKKKENKNKARISRRKKHRRDKQRKSEKEKGGEEWHERLVSQLEVSLDPIARQGKISVAMEISLQTGQT